MRGAATAQVFSALTLIGGTFYMEVQVCCSDNLWTVKVIG
jgi:hypothetical protein